MDDTDDFGDLYAGLDTVFAAAAAAYDDPPPPTEDTPATPIAESNVVKETAAAAAAAAVAEADGNGVVAESSGDDSSDSEDDLRIVLNDGDGPPQRHGNGPLTAAGWQDEDDEDDNLVLVTDKDRPGRDQKWADQVPPQMADGGAARGGAAKSGYRRSWHASHSGGFPNNTRTSLPGRGDRDHLLMPMGTMSFKAGIPAGTTFSLPRNRTIFDIDIEEFAQKPWKHHGVDVTDYFNFGLDEESWKSYCKSMDICRQPATLSRFPFYEPSRLNQPNGRFYVLRGGKVQKLANHSRREVLEVEMVSTNVLSSDVACGGQWERSSYIHENIDKGVKVPRGRAIQVEGSFGERIPSTDIRRPRLRDSDVVIQIATEDSVKDASAPSKGKLKMVKQRLINDSVLESENDSQKSSSLKHDGHRFEETTCSVEHRYRQNDAISGGTIGEVIAKVSCEKDDAMRPSRPTASASRLADDSVSCDQLLHCSSPSGLENHSVASKDGLSSEKVLSPGKKTSSSVSGLQELFKSDYYPSNESRSDATKQEYQHSEDSVPDCRLSMGDKKVGSRTRLQGKAELTILTDSENVSGHAHKKRRSVTYSMELSCRMKARKHDHFYARGHLSSYEESEMSHGFKRRKDAETHDGDKPYFRRSHRNGNRDTYLQRMQEETFFSYKQRVATKGNGVKEREFNVHERCYDDHRMRAIAREDCNKLTSGYKSLPREKDSCLWQKKERNNNERWISAEPEHDDIVLEERYKEKYLQEVHGRHIPYCERKYEVFDHDFDEHMSYTAREFRSPERCLYDSHSCFDLNRSSGYLEIDEKNRRYRDQRLLDSQAYRNSPITEFRSWLDTNSPTNHLPVSWRPKERLVNHRSNTRETRYKKMENGCYFVPNSKDHHRSSYANTLSFDNDDHSASERDQYVDNIVYNENRRFNRLDKPRHCTNDIQFRHENWDDMFSPEVSLLHDRSSWHEKSRVSHRSGSGWNFYDDHLCNNAAKKKISKGISGSDSRDHSTFVSDFFDKGRNELAAVGRREAANMHLNSWKGKFPNRSNELKHENGGQSDMGRTRDKKLKDGAHTDEVKKRKKCHPNALKGEGSCVRPTNVQVERVTEIKLEHSKDLNIKDYRDNNSVQQADEDDEIEEGQLIEESDGQDVVSVTKGGNSDTKMYLAVETGWSRHAEEINRQSKDLVRKTVGGYDSNRILETLAKMEKRRERFKEPIIPKPVSEKIHNPVLEVAVAEVQVQQQRPARKRRWAGS